MVYATLNKPNLPQATLLILCMASCLNCLLAQPMNLVFQHLNQADGLSQGICTFSSRDRSGFLWVGTTDGLNRFDGQRIKTYRPNPALPHSLVGNNITSRLFEDEYNDLWFTTNNAIHRYNRATDNFDVFRVKGIDGQEITDDYYAFHFDTEGRFWCRVGLQDKGRLHLFDTRQLRDSIYCPLEGFRACVFADTSGAVRVVISTMLGKPGMVVTDVTRNFKQKTYLAGIDGDPFLDTSEAYAESDSAIWVGLLSGMARLNLLTGRLQIFDDFERKKLGTIWGISPYGPQLLYVSSINDGLLLFDKKLGRFIQQHQYELGTSEGLQSNECHDLYIDEEENLWLSQWGNGLSFVNLRKNKFRFLPRTKGQFVSFINAMPDGNIMCSTRAGIFIYSAQSSLLEVFDNRIAALPDPVLLAPLLPKDHLYFYRDRVFALDWGNKKLRLVQEIKDLGLRQVLLLPTGEHLAVCSAGLFLVEKDSKGMLRFSPYPIVQSYGIKSASFAFCNRRGQILVSDNHDLLLVFERSPHGLSLLKSIPGMGECKAFWEDPKTGSIWIASTAGLAKLESDLSLHMLNEAEDGLPNETYYAVLPDRKGQLWLPSNRGLWCYDPASRSRRGYVQSDGLTIREFNTNAWHQFANGEIWAGGIGGLVAFHPDSLQPVPFQPRVQFTQILVNDLPREGGQPPETTTALNLPYSQNTLSFEFVALEFSDPSANQFQYRLVGYDEAWVKSGTRGFARYANLPPGQYVLEVLAANSDGVWLEVPKTMTIHIQAPFWQTWWFYLLCALILAVAVYAWFRYRLQQALKIERMRVQISSDLHDDVGTMLAGLAMQSEALELTAPEKDKSKLKRISEISRNAMAHMRDTVWAIDARKDKFENLLDRMREHAEETLTPRDIRFDIQVENLSLKQNLTTNTRQNLYLIYKEAITNAAKHSNGDMVMVSLKKIGTGFEMRICDNGNMTEKSYKTTGLGTSNMQLRAEKLGGTMTISRDKGFCVVLGIGKLG